MTLSCAMSTYAFLHIGAGEIAGDWFPFAAIISFLVVLFGVNPLLRLIGGERLELNRVELLLVFVMAFIAAPMATTGFAASFFSHSLGPAFYATQSNQWWERLGQYRPGWLFPDDARAVTWFWEGMPPGESIPWGAWVSPLLFWAVIIAALHGLLTATVVFLRKQWVENERLIFPLMEVPTLLVEDYEKGRRLPPVMRDRLFWIGFFLVVVILGSRIANGLNPSFPAIKLLGQNVLVVRFTETWTEMRLHLFPAIIAIGYLVKRDVLFSVWLFGLLAYFERNIMKSVGYASGVNIAFEGPNPAMAWQGCGALFMFVATGLYMGRNHLRGVWRKIIRNDPSVDDSGECMSYRAAGIIFALSFITLEAFFVKMGMTFVVATTLIVVLLFFYIGVTRFVIEGGIALCRPSLPAIAVVIGLFGTKSMPLLSMGALAACTPIINDLKAGFMPSFANALKLTENERLKRRTLLYTALIGLIGGLVLCTGLTLYFCYDVGAANGQAWLWRMGGKAYHRSLVQTLDGIADPDKTRMLWGGIGAAMMAVLSFGRYTFAWWPIHPIGLPIATTWGVMMSLLSLFVAWMAKTIILRVGGATLFARYKPFFIGMLVGHVAIVTVGYVCNLITGPPGVNVYV